MTIYTKKGDKGKTSLFGDKNKTRFKDEQRITAYGTIDELNSALGVVLSNLPPRSKIIKNLLAIQPQLMEVASELATAPRTVSAFVMSNIKTIELEKMIDGYQAKLPELKNFILPGGENAASHLHLARTICRRAEREVVRLSRSEPVNEQILIYLNRLSDLLFVLARTVNYERRKKDIVWRPR